MKAKRLLSVLMYMALVFTLLPATARAENVPDLTVAGGTLDTDYAYSGNDLIFQRPGTYTVSMAEGVASTTALRIVVKNPGASSDRFCITLDGVNIDKVNNDLCAFEIQQPSVVNLTLAGNNYLTSGANNAGVRCSTDSTLTIGGSGYLEANGGTSDMFGGGAGIGENSYHAQAIGAVSGTINITGGTVIANGGGGAAGIGGGSGTNCGVVNISGGTVTATGGGGSMGGSHGAGIGAGLNFFGDEAYNGHNGNGGTVTISGGIVTARGVNHAAGIGGAYVNSNIDGAKGGTLTITGGFVEAIAGSSKVAGIGGGHGGAGKGGDGANIVISGGTVMVRGWIGAGLSTGTAGDPGTCVITGGSLKTDLNGMKPTPTNGQENVYLTTVTLDDASGPDASAVLIDSLTASLNGLAYSYGVHDMATDADSKLYLCLPDGALTTEARTGFAKYTGSVATDTDVAVSSGTLMFLGVSGVSPSGTNAVLNGNIAITFSRAMNPAAATVSLDGGSTYLTGGNWNAERTVYTLPYSGLNYGTTYTISISGFEDDSGNVMMTDDSHSFTTLSVDGGDFSVPAYSAGVTGGGTLNVTVNPVAGNASVNINAQLGGSVSGGGSETVSMPSIPGVTSCTLGIPVSYLSTPGGGSLTFNTDTGSMTLPANMLSGVPGAEGKQKAAITIGAGDKSGLSEDEKAAVGDRPLIELSLTIDGVKTDWNNPGAPVIVFIPYTPSAEECLNPDSIVIWYIDGAGNLICVPNGHYDAASGTVTFSTTHFSLYAVGYSAVGFNDVAESAWYYDAVYFIAAREITTGTGGGNYSPDAKLTRGDVLVMLMKACEISPDENPTDNFSDAGDTYYTGYLAAAKRLGITSGVGNNMYAPGKEITRQEMFALLYNARMVNGQLPQSNSGRTLSDFTDAGQIDAWAKEAMTLLVETGAISGDGGLLNPTGMTTRAEMAQALYNLLGKS